MSKQHPFTWRHFEAEIMLFCVRWYPRVRHVTDFSILPQAERTGRRFFGSRADLKPKGRGDNSMLLSVPKEASDLLSRESVTSLRRSE